MLELKSNTKIGWVPVSAACVMAMAMGLASLSAAQSGSQAVQPHRTHKPAAAHPVATPPVQPEQAAPPQPEAPKWPANDPPTQPSVTWNSQGLHIMATNSSLSQILNQVSTSTGAKIEGVSGDERVFGEFGPGQPREVLSQLLQGSSYNFLLLGSADGALKVVLSGRSGGGARPGPPDRNINRPMPSDSEPDEDQVQEPEPEEQPQPIQPPPQPEQANPQGAMTPQQRMQMMQQQRLQQMQQMQQQYPQQQQQPQ